MENLFQLFYECTGVSTDTRNIKENELYIALKGETFNGNQYAQKAIEAGAKYAIVDEKEFANGKNIHLVEDGLVFLQKLAEFHRKKFNIPFIGITGSNGKTTTKELIAAVLNERYKVHYTQGNLNNHIGVPLTLLAMPTDSEIAIIEMGASKLGDIKELTDIAHPTHAIITNIGTAHIEGFGSQENILTTKTELYRAVEEIQGHVFFNQDDELLKDKLPNGCTYSSYGIEASADIYGTLIAATPQVSFKWNSKDYHSPTLQAQIIGKYNLYNMLAAVCVGIFFEVKNEKINKALESYTPSNNRSQLEKTANNQLILDAYNANPTSLRAALENFAEIDTEEKLFIIGDMLELGPDTLDYHNEIIALTKQLQLQGIFVGKLFQQLAEENDILAFPSTKETKRFLQTAKPKNNLILLKGSRGIGLEKLVEVL